MTRNNANLFYTHFLDLLEVEFRKSVEPVTQLTDVVKLHLEPGNMIISYMAYCDPDIMDLSDLFVKVLPNEKRRKKKKVQTFLKRDLKFTI